MTRLECPACQTAVSGAFTLSRLAALREPHASLLLLFLRVRGNVKDLERLLGLSYPTVRARLDEAFAAAGLDREESGSLDRGTHSLAQTATMERTTRATEEVQARSALLDALERGDMSAAEVAAALRERYRRTT